MTMGNKLEAFKGFVAERDGAGDWCRFIAPSGMKLVRTKICDQCQFPRSTIYQDDVIVRFLDDVEKRLRRQGILKSKDTPTVAETLDENEQALEKLAEDALVRADALLTKCRTLAEKLDHLSRYHPAYPGQGK